MKITYIYHSSFLVELENHLLLFDYYQGKLPYLDPNKSLYIFVSHSHNDHYNKSIYQIVHPNKKYILSHDILDSNVSLYPNESYQIDDLEIITLLSTDLGLAYCIKVEEKMIYHAGDLNWWDWKDEDQEFLTYQKETYKKQIKTIHHLSFDVMFVVVDPRLEKTMNKGLSYLISKVKSDLYIPMHFSSNPQYLIKHIIKHPNIQILTDNNPVYIKTPK